MGFFGFDKNSSSSNTPPPVTREEMLKKIQTMQEESAKLQQAIHAAKQSIQETLSKHQSVDNPADSTVPAAAPLATATDVEGGRGRKNKKSHRNKKYNTPKNKSKNVKRTQKKKRCSGGRKK